MKKQEIIICRCEDVTLEDLQQLMEAGYTDYEELKRLLRIGMGPCQGTTCGQLVQRELAKFLNVGISEIKVSTERPPIMGVKLILIKEGADNEG
jgi:bacterioferritin-associated ferredoxin